MRTFSLVVGLCVAALALGVPSSEDVVPDTAFYEATASDESSFDEARQLVSSMTEAGKTDKDCRKLATESKKEITNSVKTSQKILDALPTGKKCTEAHDATVKKAEDLKAKADNKAKDAGKKVDKSCDVKINFGKIHLRELSPGKCDVFYSKSVYKNARKACDDAKKAKEKADGAKDEAAKALKKSKDQAAKDHNKCLCKIQKDHKKAWADATKSADANKMAWAKAHHICCKERGVLIQGCRHDCQRWQHHSALRQLILDQLRDWRPWRWQQQDRPLLREGQEGNLHLQHWQPNQVDQC